MRRFKHSALIALSLVFIVNLLAAAFPGHAVGATLSRLTSASPPGRESQLPSISGDGSRVVFLSDSDFLIQGIPDDHDEIWLYEAATTNLRRVTFNLIPDPYSFGDPKISGDGSKVVFDLVEIWLYDVATSDLTQVTTASAVGRSSVGPAINADGS